MRIARITSAKDLRPLFEFRHRIYVEELGWLEGSGGLLVDEFDGCAVNYAAFSETGELIGSVRVVPDGSLGLPLEHCLHLDGFRAGKRLAEISRLAVDPAHRCSRLGARLMKAAYQRCVAMGVTHIMLDTYVDHDESATLYERMGFEQLSEPYHDPSYRCDLSVVTLALDIARAHRELPSKSPGIFRFFTSDDDVIDHG